MDTLSCESLKRSRNSINSLFPFTLDKPEIKEDLPLSWYHDPKAAEPTQEPRLFSSSKSLRIKLSGCFKVIVV